jgi:LytS/YehU family sensor histidine kinase
MKLFQNFKIPDKQKLSYLIKHSIGSIVGFLVGGVAGYFYYRTVGCSSGACAITSNPYLTIIWGGLLGYLIGSTFNRTEKNKENEK